ncbi:MAG: HAD hydrolase family protein [bacterium]|nr:HAD hydrolase family protein [bacterium]MDT8365268.1 HAD hydrolase family protein [bacterium]
MKEQSPSIIEAAKKIKLIVFDVDGVLTDGKISYTSSGEELKSFNVRDGHATKMAFRAGLTVAIITGRKSPMVQRRCEELGIELLFQGIKNKHLALDELMESTGFGASHIAYMGDDVVDLPVMMSVGLGCSPSDAAEEVRQRSDLVTGAPGGNGAARELIFFILQAKGLLEGLIARYIP